VKGTHRQHIVLAVLLAAGVLCTGCGYQDQIATLEAQLAQSEDELESTREALQQAQSTASECEDRLATLSTDFEALQEAHNEKDTTIAELTEEVSILEEENEFLRLPPPEKVEGEIASYIDFKRYKASIPVMTKLFPSAGLWWTSRSTGSLPLATVKTLEDFLKEDHTESPPSCRYSRNDYCDSFAYQLKDNWDESGLPQLSLGLIKLEVVDPSYGSLLAWRNIFLTEEDGDFVFYEVNPCDDSIIKIEEPSDKYKKVMLLDGGVFK